MKNKTVILVAFLLALSLLLSFSSLAAEDVGTDADSTDLGTGESPAGEDTSENNSDTEDNSLLSKIVAVFMATMIVVVSVIAAIKKPKD